jgi:hypothetical protein
MLLEYSNGSSNLVGLPFLYITATVEILRAGIISSFNSYQKINVALVAEFLDELEDKSYVYFKDLEEIKDIYPYLYFCMKPNGVKSILFYALYDDENAIGCLAVSSITHSFERADVLPRVAEAAQVVSALLNFDKIKEELK